MVCNICKKDKSESDMIICFGRNGKTYIGHQCKKCVHDKRKIVGSKAWLNNRFSTLKHEAKKRGWHVDLTLQDYVKIISAKKCYFCGEKDIIKSIDRLDNSIGYTVKNCVMACLKCNMLKGKLTIFDKKRMFKILRKIV